MKVKLLVVATLIFCCSIFTTILAGGDNSFEKVHSKGKLIVGLDDTFAPMGFKNENGQLLGFDVDLAKEVGKRLGVEVVFKPCAWSQIFSELNKGNVDAVWSGVTINEKRKVSMLFSNPYMTNRIVVLVDKNSNINKIADLNGKVVAVQVGTTAIDHIKNYQGADAKPLTIKKMVQHPNGLSPLVDLVKRSVDAVVADEVFADYYANVKDYRFKKLTDFFSEEQYGVAFRKNDVTLCDKVQLVLDEMIKDGTAAQIGKKWFGRNVFPGKL